MVTTKSIPGSIKLKMTSVVDLMMMLPENERVLVDVLRQLLIENLPDGYKEKMSYNVPFFYGKRGVCIIWPASVAGGGVNDGVLLGFWHGNRLADAGKYLTHGTNKQVYYKIFHQPDEIDEAAIVILLKEAVKVDGLTAKRNQF
jgi:hypothetical protein